MGKLYWIVRVGTVYSQGPYKPKREAREWESETERDGKMPCCWLRRKKEPLAKQCGWPQVAGRDKETDSPLASSEGTRSYLHFDVSP